MVEMRDPNSAAAQSALTRHRAATVANPYRRSGQRTGSSRIISEPTHDEEEEYSSSSDDGDDFMPTMPSNSAQEVIYCVDDVLT